jgi:hypothetical protein
MPMNHSSSYADLTAEQAELIGRFVVEWPNIEFLLSDILGRLLMPPDFVSRVFTDSINAFGLQQALDKAIRIHTDRYCFAVISEPVLGRLSKMLGAVDELRGMCNRFLHFCWTRSTDEAIFGSGFSGYLPSDKRYRGDVRTLSVSEIRAAHKKAWDLVEDLSAFILAVPQTTEDDALCARGLSIPFYGEKETMEEG